MINYRDLGVMPARLFADVGLVRDRLAEIEQEKAKREQETEEWRQRAGRG